MDRKINTLDVSGAKSESSSGLFQDGEFHADGARDGENVVSRELDTKDVDPAVQIAQIVAELNGEDPLMQRPLYESVGDLLENVFSAPSAQESEVQLVFTYEGYRITVEGSGHAIFVKEE